MTNKTRKITAGISALAMIFCMGGYFPTLPAFEPTQSITMTAKAAEYQFEQVVGDYTAWVIIENDQYTGVSLGRYTGTATAVTIPSSVKVTIEEEELSLPVTEIGNNVLANQNNITSVTIPDSVKIVRSGAFYGTGIKEIVFPEGVERIEWDVLACCPNLTSVSLPSTLKYLGAVFTNGHINYQSHITELDVNFNLEEGSLNNFPDVETIRFGKNVTSNLAYLCEYMDNLKTVIFDKDCKITEIGERAFYGCGSLSEIIIPDSVKIVGKEAFQYCGGLTNIVIGDGVEVIGESAFAFDSRGEYHVSETSVTFGKNIRTIGNYAFSHVPITGDMVIPDSVETIGNEAFNCNGNLETVKFGKNLKSIGNSTFWECRNLLKATFNEGLESIGESCFYACNLRGTLTLKSGLKSIGVGAFLGQAGITNIVLPDGLETIESQAFQNTSTRKIIIPDSVKTLGTCAFMGNGQATVLRLPNRLETIPAECFRYCEKLTCIVIPNSVKTIEAHAFRGCTGVLDLQLGNSVEVIGEEAFGYQEYGATKIRTLHLPDSLKELGYGAFEGSGQLRTIENFPESLTKVGNYAFADCQFLRDIPEIPASWGTIPDSCFAGSQLARIRIQDGITKIGSDAFKVVGLNDTRNIYYGGISELVIPDSVTRIMESAFYGQRIEKLTLGNSLEIVGNWAFMNGMHCYDYVEVPDTLEAIGSQAFGYWCPTNESNDASAQKIDGFFLSGNNAEAKDYCNANGFIYNGTKKETQEYVDEATGVKVIAEPNLTMTVEKIETIDEMNKFLGWSDSLVDAPRDDYDCTGFKGDIHIAYNITFTKDGEPYSSEKHMKVYLPMDETMSSAKFVYVNKNYGRSKYGNPLCGDAFNTVEDGYTWYYADVRSDSNFFVVECFNPQQGDISLNGTLDVSDVIIMQRYLHGAVSITENQWKSADMNGDGNVNIYDLALLKRVLLNN